MADAVQRVEAARTYKARDSQEPAPKGIGELLKSTLAGNEERVQPTLSFEAPPGSIPSNPAFVFNLDEWSGFFREAYLGVSTAESDRARTEQAIHDIMQHPAMDEAAGSPQREKLLLAWHSLNQSNEILGMLAAAKEEPESY